MGELLFLYKKNNKKSAYLNKKLLKVFQQNFSLNISSVEAYFDLYILVLNQPIKKPKSSSISSFVDAKFLLE